MIDLRLGDCRTLLPTIPSGSVDCVLCDPPYPEIDRPYGRLTEAEWHGLMRVVVAECRRVLKPSGSAVFILQPNFETPGRMRLWLWEFVLWAGREWNLIQDTYWWNLTALPTNGTQREVGLMRSSVKWCVWLGPLDCYRNQDEVLWLESDGNKFARLAGRCIDSYQFRASGKHLNDYTCRNVAAERGGTTPFNLLPIPAGGLKNSTGGHGAPTPLELCDWWVRYISPPGGVVLDPFMGGGTIPLAAIRRNRSAIGFEQMPEYFQMAQARLDGPPTPLFDGIADLPVADETPLFSGATS